MEMQETEEPGRVWPQALETEELMEAGRLRTASKDRQTEDAGKRGGRWGCSALGLLWKWVIGPSWKVDLGNEEMCLLLLGSGEGGLQLRQKKKKRKQECLRNQVQETWEVCWHEVLMPQLGPLIRRVREGDASVTAPERSGGGVPNGGLRTGATWDPHILLTNQDEPESRLVHGEISVRVVTCKELAKQLANFCISWHT